MVKLALVAAVVGIACHPLTVGAQDYLYSWTDEKGVVNFSNTAPPQGVEAKAMVAGGGFRPVPLEVEENRKLVSVDFEGTRQRATVRMIVDTGAQKTMIDPALAKQIGVRYLHSQIVGGVTGVGVASMVEVPRLWIGSAELRDLDVLVGSTPGMSLLGMDVLGRLDLTVGPSTLFRGGR